MNNSSSLSSSTSAAAKSPSKLGVIQHQNKDSIVDDVVTINEKVNLTKNQYEVLNMICKTYRISVSEYMQQALVEAMRFDIEEGNFCDALLEKLGGEDSKKHNNSAPSSSPASPFAPDLMNSDLDLLKKLQTEIP